MTDDPASKNAADAAAAAAGVNLSKIGLGAMGDVTVNYDASHKVTNNVSHQNSSNTHNDNRSEHHDQSVNTHNTHNTHHHHAPGSGMGASMVALVAVLLGGIILLVMALRPQEARSGGSSSSSSSTAQAVGLTNTTTPAPPPPSGSPTAPAPAGGGTASGGGTAPQPAPAPSPVIPPPTLTPAATAPPVIESAEVGILAQGRFIPCTEFKTNDLLTLRVRVSRRCHLRAIYQQASGPPLRMFPETDGGSDEVSGGAEVYIPDPSKIAAKAADATAFQLFHDTGSGPPIREQIVIQVAEEPFTTEGTSRTKDMPYRVFEGVTLAEARMRGVMKLQGLSVSQAQAKMDALLSERALSFTIRP